MTHRLIASILLLAASAPAQQSNWLPVGGGCIGACGGYPWLDTGGAPAAVGQPISFNVAPLQLGTPVMLYGGTLLPVQIDLGAIFSAPSCFLITDAAAGVVLSGVAGRPESSGYSANFGLVVPNDQALVGLLVAFQALALDACTTSGVVLSWGAAAVLQ